MQGASDHEIRERARKGAKGEGAKGESAKGREKHEGGSRLFYQRLPVPRPAEVERNCECGSTLTTAFITQRDIIPGGLKRNLAPIVGKYLG